MIRAWSEMNPVLPAEWAPQSAVQLTWPRPEGDFADSFDAVEACFRQLAAAIPPFEKLIIAWAHDVVPPRTPLPAARAPHAPPPLFAPPQHVSRSGRHASLPPFTLTDLQ